MESQNSLGEVDFYLGLFRNLFVDLCDKYPSKAKSLKKDLEVLLHRSVLEGLSFVTKTLPKLGKALDRALECGSLNVPREFKRSRYDRTIPAFMQAMFSDLFGITGELGPGKADIIKDLRQVLYLAYKIELPYSSEDESRVITRFVDVEEELSTLDIDERDLVIKTARLLIGRVLKGFNPRRGTPRHGPGAVATGERGDMKWEFSRLYNCIHQRFPYYEYFMVYGRDSLLDNLQWYKNLQRMPYGSAKVILVPKDSRGPRLISCEPLEFQWIQQMIGRELVRHLESNIWTRGRVNFTDQTINQNLALENSVTREFSTLDMKDASDRVSLQLVENLFPKELFLDLCAARTESTVLPSGQEIPLRKFAPMGSALCFPIEALVFWALGLSTLVVESRLPVNIALRYFRERVFVYGDDIIVPTKYARSVIETFQRYGLLFNVDKCFIDGSFRESCGVDAFMGTNVTPVKVRTRWSGKRSDGKAFVSYASQANSLAQYPTLASFIRKELESLYGKLPYGTPNSGFPCIEVKSSVKAALNNVECGRIWRWNPHLHRAEFRVRVGKVPSDPSELDGWRRLLRNLVYLKGGPPAVTRVRSVKLRTEWKPV